MVRVLETQTVAPNSIQLPLHVVLELNKHTLTLAYGKSEHDETWKLAMGQRDGQLPPYGWKDMNV